MNSRVVDLEFPNADVKVILAAAGNGKTTRLMQELVEALKVYRPDEIAMATFTRKGVSVAVERATKAVPGLSPKDIPYFGTFHKLFFRALGLSSKAILERSDLLKFNNLLGFNLTSQQAFDNQTDDDRLLQRYDAIRSGSETGVYIESLFDEERYDRLINSYEKFKGYNNLIDYHDVLTLYEKNGEPINVKVALMDEFQDSTTLQCRCIQKAFGHCERVRIVGDDYQTIFSFAGAVPETLIHLASKYPTEKLEKSYRLSKAVYEFSKNITHMISQKVTKDFYPARAEKGLVERVVDRRYLAKKVGYDLRSCDYKPGRWFFLFRANCFITAMAQILEDTVVPYHTGKGFCLEKSDLLLISRYHKYQTDGDFDRNVIQRFMAKHSIISIKNSFVDSELIPSDRKYIYQEYVDKYGIDRLIEMADEEPSLLLTTTFKVKGGEADKVAVFMDATRIVCENMVSDLDTELRVMYVACTRPRDELYLVSSDGQYGLDSIVDLAIGGFSNAS